MKTFVFYLVLLCSVLPAAHARDFDPEKFIADGAVLLFATGCVKYYSDPEQFSAWIEKNTFDPIPAKHISGLIKEAGGKAWSVNNNGVRYVLAAEAGNLCTVFVKEVNLGKARASFTEMRKGLAVPGVDERVQRDEQELDLGTVTTTQYTYSSQGKSVLRLVITESNSEKGFFQLAMSASSGKRQAGLK